MTQDKNTRAKLELISKAEKRRLLFMGGLFVVAFTYVFMRPHTPLKPAEDAAGLVPVRPTSQDPAAVLETLKRHEAHTEGGADLAPVQSFQLDPKVLLGVKDGELDVVEEEAFYHLLARVRSLSDEEIAELPQTEGTWTWEQLRTDAGRDQARGKFARLQGRFWTPLFQRVLMKYPNEAGVAWVWQGTFRHLNRGFFVTITDKTFEPKPGAYGDNVELTGAFLKIYAFEAADDAEGPIKSYPHLIVKSVRKLPQTTVKTPGETPNLPAILMVVFFCTALVVAFFYVRGSRKGEERFEAWRAQRVQKNAREALKAQLDQAAKDAAPPVTAPTPSPTPSPTPTPSPVPGTDPSPSPSPSPSPGTGTGTDPNPNPSPSPDPSPGTGTDPDPSPGTGTGTGTDPTGQPPAA